MRQFEIAGAEPGTFSPLMLNLWGPSQFRFVLAPRTCGTQEKERKLKDLVTGSGERLDQDGPLFIARDLGRLCVAGFRVPSQVPELGTERLGARLFWGCAFVRTRGGDLGRDPALLLELVWSHLSSSFGEKSALAFSDRLQVRINDVFALQSLAASQMDAVLAPIVNHYDGIAKLTRYRGGAGRKRRRGRRLAQALSAEVGNVSDWNEHAIVHMCASAWRAAGFQSNFSVAISATAERMQPRYFLKGAEIDLSGSIKRNLVHSGGR